MIRTLFVLTLAAAAAMGQAQQQKQEKKWRWVRNLVRKVGGGVGLLIWLGCLAALAVAGYFLINALIGWLGVVTLKVAPSK